MKIRAGVEPDIDVLVHMGDEFLRTVYAGLIEPSQAAMTATARHLMTTENGAVFVAERDGAIVGMLGMLAFTHPMSGERTASEVMWWVNPDARGCGLRLLREGKSWAIEQGATVLILIAPTTTNAADLYERLGYQAVETTFQMRLQ